LSGDRIFGNERVNCIAGKGINQMKAGKNRPFFTLPITYIYYSYHLQRFHEEITAKQGIDPGILESHYLVEGHKRLTDHEKEKRVRKRPGK